MSTPTAAILTTLEQGDITVKGEFMWGSNYTFLAQVHKEGLALQAVYKPTRGERPLWDFPVASLARREVAAYIVGEALGWELVPPTVYRRRAPIGPGSLQLYVEHDPEYHYFSFSQEDLQRLRPAVLFDLLVNNADRKGSHVLVDNDRHIWLIDHGICFHVDDKLRTVIWDFAGETIPAGLRADLLNFRRQLNPPSGLVSKLSQYIHPTEIVAFAGRADDLLRRGCFPDPDPGHRPIPWPPI